MLTKAMANRHITSAAACYCKFLLNRSHCLFIFLHLQVTLKYIKPGVALPDFYEVKTTATQSSPMIVQPLGQPAGTDPKGVLFNDVNAPSCTAPLMAVLGTTATPKFGIVTLNVSGTAAACLSDSSSGRICHTIQVQ
jgi:hypothetical protein